MKLIKFTPQKNTAQAMVEFAIVLPLLLLLLYGLLEVGRLLFIYSSTVTASRQAARYGATTGDGTTPGVPRFLDCAGIRQAANRVDYLNAFDHTTDDVQIFWDTGPNTGQNPICAPGLTSENVWTGPMNNDVRLIVRVEGQFNPIVRLVPLPQRDIETTSARTILVSVDINVSGGSGADTTAMTLVLSPHRLPPDGPPHSDVGEPVTVTVAITNQTGTATPTGTVNLIVRNTDTNTVVTTCSSPLVNGVASPLCVITFNETGNFNFHAEYVPDDTAKFNGVPGDQPHIVGTVSTTTQIISDYPDSSQPGQAVSIRVRVSSGFDTKPTGQIVVTTAEGTCTINLTTIDDGVGGCSVTYNNVGTTNITAAYSGDSRHEPSTDPCPTTCTAKTHTVASTAPTYAPTEILPTSAPPPTEPPPPPTPVNNCNTIRDAIKNNAIKFSGSTMYMDIPNSNPYSVTMSSIYVAWNYNGGHNASNANLKLMKVDLGTTTVWQSATGLHQPYYTISSFSNPAVLPNNATTRLTFTFDQSYDNKTGQVIQLQFSTPGCESYPVLTPGNASTPVAPPNLKVRLISGGRDDTQETQFRYQIQNIGSSAASGITVRIYFTLDGSNAASTYVLEKYYDKSGAAPQYPGVATVSGPARASGSIYYFTINYGSASMPAGETWEFQTSLHLSSWGSTHDSTNDWWHGTGALPGSYTDWTTIPVYVNSILVYGNQP